jgi:2-keto-4-pentenoate hydratase/2-oxohepta-3-ene-1,7-dioic acid hydratase in catechol pathway
VEQAKNADTFAPLGPWLVTPDDAADMGRRRIWLQKNDVVRQDSILARMIFTVPQIVVYLSEFMSLMPGDVILTGTPKWSGLQQARARLSSAPGIYFAAGSGGWASNSPRSRA